LFLNEHGFESCQEGAATSSALAAEGKGEAPQGLNADTFLPFLGATEAAPLQSEAPERENDIGLGE